MNVEVSVIFSAASIIGVTQLLIALSNFFGGKKKATKEDEARMVRIETAILNIEKNTETQSTTLKEHDQKLEKHDHRLTVVETKLAVRKSKQ